jgi:lysyl-tRNA synthetase class 2
MHVESAAIFAIDYDTRRKRLHVTFVSGQRYAYEEVPGEVHRAFLDADSKGRFFQAQIRGRYRYARLG